MNAEELTPPVSGSISAGAIIELEAKDTCLQTNGSGFIEAEYMYGCTPTALGMLLAYYDIYGYNGKDMSTLIGGVLDVDSRGTSPDGNIYDMSDPSTLANFIASKGYADRFYKQKDPQVEFDYSFTPSGNLNTDDFDSLADYIGTGQAGRNNADTLTSTWYDFTLASIQSSSQTYEVNGKQLPIYYEDFLYGLSQYVESRGYYLDDKATATTLCDTAVYASGNKGKFTFEDIKKEIDAGRPVLIHLKNAAGAAHTVTVYGYSDQDEIIFDDTYRTGCRMEWNGTYEYNNAAYTILAATTVVFETDTLYNQLGKTANDKCISLYSSIYDNDEFSVTSSINAANPLMLGATTDFQAVKAVVWQNTSSSRTSHIHAAARSMIVAKAGSKVNATVDNFAYLNIESGSTITAALEKTAHINFIDGILGTDDDTVIVGSVISQYDSKRDFTYSLGVLDNFSIWENELELYYGGKVTDLFMWGDSTLTINGDCLADGVTTSIDYMAELPSKDGLYNFHQTINVKNLGKLTNATLAAASKVELERNGTAKNIYLSRPGFFPDPEGNAYDPTHLYAHPATINAYAGSILEGFISVYGLLDVKGEVNAENADIQFGLASDITELDEFFGMDGSGLVINADQLYGADFSLITVNGAETTYNKVASYTDDSFYKDLAVEIIDMYGQHTGIFVTDTQNAQCDYKEYDMTTDTISGIKYVQFTVTDLAPDPIVTQPAPENPIIGIVPPEPSDNTHPHKSLYIVDYSLTADFANVVRIKISSEELTAMNLDNGTHYVRVRHINSSKWSDTDIITVSNNNATTSKDITISEEDVPAVIFATSDSIWSKRYAANHQGIKGVWNGTDEIIVAGYRNRFNDLFQGCGDYKNVIYLTDTDNGDGIFLDDIFSSIPDTIAKQQARLANITEIRAGKGDDIIDMTSKTYAYTGNGMTIRGGDGDDVIWSNKGENKLFGDAGDDRIVGGKGNDIISGGSGNDTMHGGGGNDKFFFGSGWGEDTIEQLTGGKVTLCFDSSIYSGYVELQYDSATGTTVTYGNNSILVKKMKLTEADLVFSYTAEQAENYDALGVFEGSSTCAIYEIEKDYDNPSSGLRYADIC